MEEENKKENCCEKVKNKCGSGSGVCGGGIYGLAFLVATFYYIQHAESFWMGVWGILKALMWPAILIYKSLEFLVK